MPFLTDQRTIIVEEPVELLTSLPHLTTFKYDLIKSVSILLAARQVHLSKCNLIDIKIPLPITENTLLLELKLI